MSNSRARLTPRQLRAIELMVRDGSSQRKVAAALDVSRQTVTLWTQDQRFTDALTAAASEVQTEVWARLRSAAAAAAQALVDIATSETEKGSVRVMAAGQILDRAGFTKGSEPAVAEAPKPYDTREELLAALATLPPDVLQESLSQRQQEGQN